MFDLSMWLNTALWISVGIVTAGTLICYLVLRTLFGVIEKRLRGLAETQGKPIYRFGWQIAARTSRFLLFAFSFLLALKLIELPSNWQSALSHSWFVVLALQTALWVDVGVRLWSRDLVSDRVGRHNPVTMTILSIMILVVVWSVMLLSILANLGVDITALVASLGVGGIAIALAVQTMLGDLFASLSIGIDKPFEIGDFVVFGDVAGSIEHIGLKTTRIRSLSGEQVVCANADLLRQTLHNYKRMDTRRIVFSFGISYATPAEKVREVSALVKRIIDGLEKARFDRAHFLAFEESKLTFEVVYIVQSSDYNQYMDIQQEINLALLQGLRDMQVEFAFPVRRVEFVGGCLPEVGVGAAEPGAKQKAASPEALGVSSSH
ncbi:mechanosensitive ion channel family protein [Pseudomonas sp. UBA6310]|uniref:mechanosensitive ion channel family protein n=1 Tax=Pseudomonas sp. UBA6310 TaxID=1947327 RepID=UPI0025797E14|nr:mechanosensitive ion channel family protein [Pseudomonas sp. UBA6310]